MTEGTKTPRFKLGDHVRKTKGSEWEGRVVGTYSTTLTPEGYAVESDAHSGSVQIYPASALEPATPTVDAAFAVLAKGRCPKCGGIMLPGVALESTLVAGDKDLGGDGITVSPGGPGKLIPCIKCSSCGWSVTG